MEKSGDGSHASKRPANSGLPARPSRSGEGARSAMEQLIQQERREREEKLPREGGGTGDTAGSTS
jgi:hypothetical protein